MFAKGKRALDLRPTFLLVGQSSEPDDRPMQTEFYRESATADSAMKRIAMVAGALRTSLFGRAV